MPSRQPGCKRKQTPSKSMFPTLSTASPFLSSPFGCGLVTLQKETFRRRPLKIGMTRSNCPYLSTVTAARLVPGWLPTLMGKALLYVPVKDDYGPQTVFMRVLPFTRSFQPLSCPHIQKKRVGGRDEVRLVDPFELYDIYVLSLSKICAPSRVPFF